MIITEEEKLQFGIEIVAAMFAERLHNGDLDAGMIDALSETETDRLGYSKEDLEAMSPEQLESIKKMVAFHKTRLHQQAMFMANTVLSSGLISQMQPELTTLKQHDKQLRDWINSMTAELKILRDALTDVNELPNLESLQEWLFDNDYTTVPMVKTEMQSDWVAVAERLPIEDGEYIVTVFTGLVRVARFSTGNFLPSVYGTVSHWMPLPQPPTK